MTSISICTRCVSKLTKHTYTRPVVDTSHMALLKMGEQRLVPQPGQRREITRSLPNGVRSKPAPHALPHTGGCKLKVIQTLYPFLYRVFQVGSYHLVPNWKGMSLLPVQKRYLLIDWEDCKAFIPKQAESKWIGTIRDNTMDSLTHLHSCLEMVGPCFVCNVTRNLLTRAL